MFHLLKKHAAAEEGKGPETVVGVQHTPGDRLDSNPVVSLPCASWFSSSCNGWQLQPALGKSVWHHVSEAFLLFSVTLALMPMYWLCAGSQRKKNKTFVVTWGTVLVQLLFSALFAT